ncbi:phage shock protein A (PspA) family protein [Thermosporothrix hazakensis]|jgi:phage shock protein A|uniref:Phage shock protein A (PspA) family protein n=2 Tax=Thermosporothrix TaxID=768650 RepID=A0A326U7B7_THEHA|nr:PspA/IM30 family protein [Thermosporothrix hazakensis]PZW30607.1 phage shock protein A (PspA) family protein [Thermosporothrix hazakensis]BBH91322.1 hypothetical protein KTC_60730 [Thermosporothrix sp. COM3]GCE49469.1 hypothetical protein KTH_43380 [Thermosporothrix hazakensis]
MGIFSFLARLLGFQRAEKGPVALIDEAYATHTTRLDTLRRAVTDITMQRKRLEIMQKQIKDESDTIQQQARYALQAGKEELARQALLSNETRIAQLHALETQIAQLRGQEADLLQLERQLSLRLDGLRTQKEMLKVQYRVATTRLQVREEIQGIAQDMNSARLMLEQAQEQVRMLREEADALAHPLLEQGGQRKYLPEPGTSHIEALQQITIEQNVETQLQAMKEELQHKQNEGPTAH